MAKVLSLLCVLLLAVFVKNGEAVRCWTCSSDIDPTCNDPFTANQPLNTHRYTLTNCDQNAGVSYPYLSGSRSFCKKAKQYVNGALVIIRGCTWKQSDRYDNQCPITSTPPYITTTFCETCDWDGCNGATGLVKSTAAIFFSIALLMLFK